MGLKRTRSVRRSISGVVGVNKSIHGVTCLTDEGSYDDSRFDAT